MAKRVAMVRGNVVNDLFLITLKVNGAKVPRVVVDTGAAALILNGNVARRLKLPNLGSVQVVGVGGGTAGFRSRCDVQIGTRLFRSVPCVVIKRFSKPGMLGLKFFRDNHLSLYLDPLRQTLALFRN
ncbi:retroviral-like aspartic protease family protein [Alicyclobacillus curvatus]|nr:retroviral-like aspartic protease family protein [Alicyclobacillus curvatus]